MRSALPWRSPNEELSEAADAADVLQVLAAVDDLPTAATGALRVAAGGVAMGSVLVEEGRVCWAAAEGWSRRLTDILRHQTEPPLERARVEEVYARCRRDRLPLGEQLVASGVVTPDGLRRALRQHTAEALVWMTRTGAAETDWLPSEHRRYDARFSFGTGELLGTIGVILSPDAAGDARRQLDDVVSGGARGLAFVRGGAALPVPVLVTEPEGLTATSVLDVGRWAVSCLDLAAAVQPDRRLVACVCPSGAGVLAWQEGDVVCVAMCDDPSTLAFAIVTRTRCARRLRGDA